MSDSVTFSGTMFSECRPDVADPARRGTEHYIFRAFSERSSVLYVNYCLFRTKN